jgi:acetate kinase
VQHKKILGAAIPWSRRSTHRFITDSPAGRSLAIPYELSLKHKIRRYGFHGLAHQYDIARYASFAQNCPRR